MQVSRHRHRAIDGRFTIDQIPINVMLHHKTTRIVPVSVSKEDPFNDSLPHNVGQVQYVPVVEDLAAHDVPADSPAVLVILLRQPRVAEHLDVEIEDLEARMVHVEHGALEKEKRVVVDILQPEVQVQERHDVLLGVRIVHQVAGLEVEVRREEVEGLLVVGDAEAEMAELVDGRRALLEALERVDWAVLAGGEVVVQFGECLGDRDACLAVHQVEGTVIYWVVERHSLPSAWSVRVVDGSCSGEGGGQLKVFHRIHDPARAAEDILCSSPQTVQKGLCAITAIVDLVVGLPKHTEAKVQEELMRSFEVFMGIIHMG